MKRLAILCALLLAGCAQNAILEITFEVPARADVGVPDTTVAVLDFRASSSATPPTGLGTDIRTATLNVGDTASTQGVSVIASADDVTTPLWIGVTYCASSAGCRGTGSQQAWIRYERGFYVGEYTEHVVSLPTADVTEVGTCEVWGCLMGERPASGGCTDGRHACEQ